MLLNGFVLPVYIGIDVSFSTAAVIDRVNVALQDLVHTISQEVLQVSTPIALVTFSDEARMIVPLTGVEALALPPLSAEGGTNYGSLFSGLTTWLRDDVAKLKRGGYRVFAPLVLFLTDGSPTDSDWRVHLRALRAERFSPTILAFGFGSADPRSLREIAGEKGAALVLEDGADVPDEILTVFKFMARSLKSTEATVNEPAGNFGVKLPDMWIDVTAGSSGEDWI